jgi:hypothetical protein
MELLQQFALHAGVERRPRNDPVKADRDLEEVERREFNGLAPNEYSRSREAKTSIRQRDMPLILRGPLRKAQFSDSSRISGERREWPK